MTHAVHVKPRRIFGDDCEECLDRAKNIEGLFALDSENLAKLGRLAVELRLLEDRSLPKPDDVSYADLKAVDNLRRAAHLVFKSGITEEVLS